LKNLFTALCAFAAARPGIGPPISVEKITNHQSGEAPPGATISLQHSINNGHSDLGKATTALKF